MKVLGLDTATSACSVALWVDGQIAARRAEAMVRGQAELLLPMVMAVMNEAGQGFADLDRFGVTVGPGAFTGLRIGLAAARGMALAAGRPLIGITTFEAVAHGLDPAQRQDRTVLVAVESKRDDIFVQMFDATPAPLGEPVARLPGDVPALLPDGPVLVAGDAATRLREALDRHPGVVFAAGPGRPDAAVVARLAALRPADAPDLVPGAPPPGPVYLRAPDVTPPRTVAPGKAGP